MPLYSAQDYQHCQVNFAHIFLNQLTTSEVMSGDERILAELQADAGVLELQAQL